MGWYWTTDMIKQKRGVSLIVWHIRHSDNPNIVWGTAMSAEAANWFISKSQEYKA